MVGELGNFLPGLILPESTYLPRKKDPWSANPLQRSRPLVLLPITFFQVFSREEWESRQNWYGVPIRFGRPQAIRRGAIGAPLKVVETWLLLQRSLTSFPF